MKEIYDWVPWFRELAKKIEEGGEAYLIEKAKEVDWGNSPSLLRYGDINIDPFSFFYFLAQRNTKNQREPVYTSVHDVFEIDREPPRTCWYDTFIIPTPTPNTAALFHNGKNFKPGPLWKLFGQAVKDKPDVKTEAFHEALNIPNVGVVKLTQCLFLINPQSFIPIDNCFPNFASMKGQIEGQNGWNVCLQAIERTKQNFPRCHTYEIARVFYLLHSKQTTLRQNFFQISTYAYGFGPNNEDDHWNKFESNNWVYTGGPGGEDVTWENPNDGNYPLTVPEPGDIILVRKGIKQGKAIGIVDKNDYAQLGGLNKESGIHVLWINKSEENISMDDFLPGMTDLGANKYSKTYQAFRNTDSYKPTFEFIESRTNDSIEEDPESYPVSQKQKPKIMENHHPLNQILYGPPGTGKTWNTVNRAVAIIDDKPIDDYEHKDRKETKERFDKLKQAGQIEMVTFHQNYAYEDFIEGIRPVLSETQKTEDGERVNKSDIKYKLSEGIFKRIAKHAEENRAAKKNYVLIIDEINRGNIAKIFGELITLIEESKRLGEKDEATATLPYSKDKEPFGIPNNLYIIGTMNTADRSIALLDTALRRRFDFIEMMPDPNHPEISNDIEGVNCQKLLEKINERIRVLHDRDHQVGHTYFIGVKKMASLAKTFQNQIIPLLQEYFYDNWEKIDLVLNKNGFIQESGVNEGLFKPSEFVDTERKIYELLPASDSKWQEPSSYIEIYETQNQRSKDEQDNKSE